MKKFPKNYNRIMLINMKSSSDVEDSFKIISEGILSRANNIDESTQDYFYMDGRGTAETVTESQKISVSFTGHRAVGDAVQDYILDNLLFDLDKRDVEFIDYDDSIVIPADGEKPVNGYRGKANIKITDFGSGDATSRQNIGFTLNFIGKPVRGTVETVDGKYKWTAKGA